MRSTWESDFRSSRWFTRGWTLQELLAPANVEFFSKEGEFLGTKQTLAQLIHEITTIPLAVLYGATLTQLPIDEKNSLDRRAQDDEERRQSILSAGDLQRFYAAHLWRGRQRVPSTQGGNQ